jgi:long-subunit acyl-CoA synthetase (AMP-forming)
MSRSRDTSARDTVCAAFRRTVAAHPDAIALRTAGGAPVYTWRQHADRVAAIAGGLATRGVRYGEPVALLLTTTGKPETRDQPDETAAAADADDWLHTGDVATRDADGYLRIVARRNIAPTMTVRRRAVLATCAERVDAHCGPEPG